MNEWKLGDANKSWTYVLPMLGKSWKDFRNIGNMLPKSMFVNAFIGDETIEDSYNNCIFLLYKFSGDPVYLDFEKSFLMSHPNFVHCYEPDKYHTMYVFTIADEYIIEYDKFLKGKYSTFSDTYKKHILKFHDKEPNSLLEDILYKREKAFINSEKKLGLDIGTIPRNQEASSLWIKEEEFFQEKYKRKNALENNEFNN